MLSVRRIEPGDVDLLRRTRLAALLDTPSAFAKTHEEESDYPHRLWASRADDNSVGYQHATFFAFDDEDCIGLVGGHRGADSAVVELVSMWTDPSSRGRGLGAMLVEAVVLWADGDAVELWVTQGNDGAQRLYERCGFEVTGEVASLPSDPCKDEVRMRCPPA